MKNKPTNKRDNDPLKSLKQQLFSKAESIPDVDDIWEHKPVSPEVFIQAEEFYGNKKSNEIYPVIIDDLNEMFSGPDYSPKYNTAVFIEGSGSGKSSKSSLAMCYMAYWLLCLRSPRKYFRLMETTLALMNMAPRADQAKSIVFAKLAKIIEGIPWFRDNDILPDDEIRSELRFPKDIRIVPGNSSENFPLGQDLFGGVIDEAEFFVTGVSDPCQEIYERLNARRFSRFRDKGLVILATTANMETCFVERFADENRDNPNVYIVRRSTFEAKPKAFYSGPMFSYTARRERSDGTVDTKEYTVPIEYEQEAKRNPRRFLKDVLAIPTLTSEPYFENWDRVLEVVNRSRPDPVPDTGDKIPESPLELYRRLPDDFRGIAGGEYVCHTDLATGGENGQGCACGFALGHRGADVDIMGIKLPTIYIDLVTRFKGGPGNKIDFSEVREFIWRLKQTRGFNIIRATYDGWNSEDSVNAMLSLGIQSDQCGANKNVYDTLKTTLYEGRVDFYYNTVLFSELKRLEDKGTKVDHALLASKDEADCFARVCYMIQEGVTEQLLAEPEEIKKPRPKFGITGQGLFGGRQSGGMFGMPSPSKNLRPKPPTFGG